MLFRVVTYGTAAFIGTMMGIWTIDREPASVTLKTQVLTPSVMPGAELRIRYTVRRARDCGSHFDRVLLDSNRVRVVLPDVSFAKPPAPLGDDTYISTILVPPSFAAGPAIYRVIPSYTCNMIHRLFWPITLDPVDVLFDVLPPLAPELRTPPLLPDQ